MSIMWDSITIDHKVPRSLKDKYSGNIHDVDNLNIMCLSCASLKGQTTLEQFLTLLHDRNEEVDKLRKTYKNITAPIIAPMYPDVGLGLRVFGPNKSIRKLRQ